MQCTPRSSRVGVEAVQLFSIRLSLVVSSSLAIHTNEADTRTMNIQTTSEDNAIRSGSESLRPQETDSPRDNSRAPPNLPQESAEDQQHHITMAFDRTELQAPQPAFLRPRPVSLISLPKLEARRKSASATTAKSIPEDVRPSSSSARRADSRSSTNDELDPVQRDPGCHGGQSDSASSKPSGSFHDSIPDAADPDRLAHLSYGESLFSGLHSAWVSTDEPSSYRHLATGEVFRHQWKVPNQPGPSADEIPKGWEAKLASEDEETWNFVHCATGTVIDTPPKDLAETVIKQFDLAASYGNVPEYCQGHLEDGRIMYKITNPSRLCPTEWRTAKHPKIIEDDMEAYLANFRANSNSQAEATLLTKNGQRLPVDLGMTDISQMSGILLITGLDKAMTSVLCAAQPRLPDISFFVISHLLLRNFHEDEATKELECQVQGWYWMSRRKTESWAWRGGSHYDVKHDDERCRLHFGYAQYLDSRLTLPNDTALVRLSLHGVSRKLSKYAL